MSLKSKKYRVEVTPRFRKMLKKLDYKAQLRTLGKLKELEVQPHSFKRLRGPLTGRYAMRIGNYRVIYTIDEDKTRVVVHTVVHRRIAYER